MLSSNRILLILSVIALATLSCKAVTSGWSAIPTATAAPVMATPSETLAATLTPPAPPVKQPSLTAVEPGATFTLAPQLTPSPTFDPAFTPDATATARQIEVFEQLWKLINENYLYADFNGLDWKAVHDEYSQRIQAGISNEHFYLAMQEMVRRLGDEHSSYFSPEEVVELDRESAGEYNYVGIGVMTSAVPERQRVTVLIVFPGSPAERAGIRAHDSILAVDGQAILDDGGIRTNLLRGPEGTTVTVTIQSPGSEPRTLQIIRQRIAGGLPVPYNVFTTPQGKRIGYVLLVTLLDTTVDDQLGQALHNLTASGQLDGIIIDNRQNSGGSSDVLLGVLAYFTNGEIGYFVDRRQERALEVTPIDINGSQQTPMVVLVGPNTASFGEVLAGVLKDLGRAYLIGETSQGNVEVLSIYNLMDGSRAWIAASTFRPLNNPDQDWEKNGIQVDEVQPSSWDLVTTDNDPAIQASLAYFDKLLSP